jgi:citrate synthase
MSLLRKKIEEKIPLWREEIQDLLKNHFNTEVSQVNVQQLLRGLRGVRTMLCNTSHVDPQKGLFIRDYPLLDLVDKLPEEVFFLLCTGELPTRKSLVSLQNDFGERLSVPDYVWKMVRQMPEDSHPMAILSICVLAMQKEAEFWKRYLDGMPREKYWIATLEDSLNIIAKLPVISAGIYRIKFLKKDVIEPNPALDMATNFVHMLGIHQGDQNFINFIRRFMIVHSDHEGGYVAVHSSRLVNSALSDLYYSISSGINGLAGPIHGLANQEMVKYVLKILDSYNGIPDDEELKKYVWNDLKRGKIIPGFGHAVLREQDPRFLALYELGKKTNPNEIVFQLVEKLVQFVPSILVEHGKVSNPNPNIDAISGALLYHFGMKEFDFYAVMFAMSHVLGICAQLIYNQAIFHPLIRPRSVTLDWLKKYLAERK